MNVWMIIYKGLNGKWMPSGDFPLRATTRKLARAYCKKHPGLLEDGSYRIAKFTTERPT